MLAQGLLMPIQRPTPAVAVAVAAAVGPLTLDAVHLLTQPVSIQLQHMGGLQHLLVSLPGLPEGFVMLVVSPLGPGAGSHWVTGPWISHSSPSLAFL